MDLTLEEEIRRVLIFTGRPLHPEDIRRLVFDNRPLLGVAKREHSIKTIKRVMQKMNDVETVYDARCKTWKRRLINQNNYVTRVEKWVKLFLLNAVLLSCQLTRVIKDLLIKLRS